MSNFHIVSVLFLALYCSQVQAQSSSCSSLDLTPVPGDCSRFYRCSFGVLYTISCPYGLLFDINSRVCNYANQVQCVSAAPCSGPQCGGATASPTIPPCGTNCGVTSPPSQPTIPPCGTNCAATTASTSSPGLVGGNIGF